MQNVSVAIVFETHSTSTDNEAGIATGWLQGELSVRGRSQAEELGARRGDDGIDAVFASDLRRAVETVEIAFEGSGLPVFLDWRLRECDYGAWNGMPSEQLAAERVRRVDEPFPEGESWRDAVRRVQASLDDIAAVYHEQRVLVIGHVATRWALDHYVDGRSLESLAAAPFDWREGWEYVYPRR
jgi:2,3-bisphosphoglycerate-dependent phosphoglycerate mutase